MSSQRRRLSDMLKPPAEPATVPVISPAPATVQSPRPAFSGTVAIGPNGYWTGNWPVMIAAIQARNAGNFHQVMHLDGVADSGPESGPGVHHLPVDGAPLTVPGWGNVITIYGAAGEPVELTVYAHQITIGDPAA